MKRVMGVALILAGLDVMVRAGFYPADLSMLAYRLFAGIAAFGCVVSGLSYALTGRDR